MRIIGCEPDSECARTGGVGREAVIVAIPSRQDLRRFRNAPPLEQTCDIVVDGEEWFAATYYLAPLTDPKADEFIERVKSWKPYIEPKVCPYPTVNLPK